MINNVVGEEMYGWARDLYPLCRSITGQGIRDTLNYIKNIIPDLMIREVTSGEKAFDWTVPDEWTVYDAYIEDELGNRIVDFKLNNLHIVGYSESVNRWISRSELESHLHSLPDQPDAIPYVTSYYSRAWGFCLTHNKRMKLKDGKYHVVINSKIKPGILNYGEIILAGREEKEIFLSTYICHPSMANNELSGPVVAMALVLWLLKNKNRRYTYRIIFIPETIGSIVYLSRHAKKMQELIVAGFNITCVGDERTFSFLPSRNGDTLADRVALHILNRKIRDYKKYSFLDRGSDERQYCSPLINLPVVSIMRSKYGTYPEYHTSLDNMTFISPKGLEGSFSILTQCISALEVCYTYRVVFPCEPQLGRRGLYPNISTTSTGDLVRGMMNILAYADGSHDLVQIADIINMDVLECAEIAERLLENKLLELCN